MAAKTYNLTDQQKKALETIERILPDSKPKWWGRGVDAERVYLNYRRDTKVYVSFDDPAEASGACVVIYVDSCGQHPNWYNGQKAKIRDWCREAFEAITQLDPAESE